jgi:hypothetical protein
MYGRFRPTTRTWRCNYVHTTSGPHLPLNVEHDSEALATIYVVVWTKLCTLGRTGRVLWSTNCSLLNGGNISSLQAARHNKTSETAKRTQKHIHTCSDKIALTPFDVREKPKALRIGRTFNRKGGSVTSPTYTHLCKSCLVTQLHYCIMSRSGPGWRPEPVTCSGSKVYFFGSAARPPGFGSCTVSRVIFSVSSLLEYNMVYTAK